MLFLEPKTDEICLRPPDPLLSSLLDPTGGLSPPGPLTVRIPFSISWIPTGRSRITFRGRSRDQNSAFPKFKTAEGRHFENGFIAIAGNHPNAMKVDLPLQILVPEIVT